MWEKDNIPTSGNELDSDNIFDEFSVSTNIDEEVKKAEEAKNKDIYYYFKKISRVLLVLNILLFIFIAISVVYIYIQTQQEKKEYSIFTPICSLFLGKMDIGDGSCYGVTPVLQEYTEKISQETQLQTQKILPLLSDVYSIENFNFSRRADFLLEKSDDRLKSLEILSAFDTLKNTFAPRDKSEISCYNISISSDNIIQLTCDAFSSDWDNSIVNLEEGSVTTLVWWGTSISRASSFIHFIENFESSPFQVLEKPQEFSVENIQNGPYTKKTTIQLQLYYNKDTDLSL